MASRSSGGFCPLLRRLAGELGVKLAATNDCHYITKADHRMQHVLTCIQTNTTVDNPSMEFATDEFYVKSRDEMAAALPALRRRSTIPLRLRAAATSNLSSES